MKEDLIPNLVRSNPDNAGFWRFEEQDRATVKIERMTSCYTEGHDKIFHYYGRDIDPSAKWFIGHTAALLNPVTGEVFMQDFGRFTFFVKHLPLPYFRSHEINSLDGFWDISVMGEEWSGFYGEEDGDEDAQILKNIYESTRLK